MGLFVHVKFTIPFKGVTETRNIELFRDGNKVTKDVLEKHLRESILEPRIEVVEFKTFPENYNFQADVVAKIKDRNANP